MAPLSAIEGASYRQPCYCSGANNNSNNDSLLSLSVRIVNVPAAARQGGNLLTRQEQFPSSPAMTSRQSPPPRSTPSPTSAISFPSPFGSTTSVDVFSKKKRSVRFSDNGAQDVNAPITRIFYPVLSREQYSPLERAACWFNSQDYTQFRRDALVVVLMATHADPVVRNMLDDVRHALRGCEGRLPRAMNERHARRQRVWEAVMGMQRWGDPAAACRPFSAASQRDAWRAAAQDAREAAAFLAENAATKATFPAAPRFQTATTQRPVAEGRKFHSAVQPQIVANNSHGYGKPNNNSGNDFEDDWVSCLKSSPAPRSNTTAPCQDLISLSNNTANGFDNGWLIDLSDPVPGKAR